jgi:hypothetical protein
VELIGVELQDLKAKKLSPKNGRQISFFHNLFPNQFRCGATKVQMTNDIFLNNQVAREKKKKRRRIHMYNNKEYCKNKSKQKN